MTAIVLTILATPASAPGESGGSSGDTGAQRGLPRVTGAVHSGAADTQLPGRVTAKVAPETAAVSPREEPGSSVRVVEEVIRNWGHAPPAARRVAPAATISGFERAEIQKETTHATSTSRAETCRSARIAAVYYRFRTWTHQELRDGRLASKSPIVAGKSCHWAKFAAREWQARAKSARRSFYRWLNDRTLRDFAFAPGADAWPKAVREVQRVFPGTEGWALSCSDAEGWSPGFDRWVVYGGRSYYPGAENDYNGSLPQVGGPVQYMFGTFTGHFRHALDALRAKGFRVPRHLGEPSVTAWRSALGQALAMTWARWSGNDDSHWSASWDSGC